MPIIVGAGFNPQVLLDVSGTSFGGSPTWTDVSSQVVAGLSFAPMTGSWGRQDQFSDVTPSTGSVTYQGNDGRFAPGKTTGMYYPWIRRGLHRRVQVGVGGTTVNLLDDYATSIQVVPTREFWTVQHAGTDILGRYGGTASSSATQVAVGTSLRSFLAEEMLLDAPTALYMLQEPEGSASFADVTGNNARRL